MDIVSLKKKEREETVVRNSETFSTNVFSQRCRNTRIPVGEVNNDLSFQKAEKKQEEALGNDGQEDAPVTSVSPPWRQRGRNKSFQCCVQKAGNGENIRPPPQPLATPVEGGDGEMQS